MSNLTDEDVNAIHQLVDEWSAAGEVSDWDKTLSLNYA